MYVPERRCELYDVVPYEAFREEGAGGGGAQLSAEGGGIGSAAAAAAHGTLAKRPARVRGTKIK